jgi:hypothetical protein
VNNSSGPYYNDDEFNNILRSYKIKSELRCNKTWRKRFRDRLEGLAWIYSNAKGEAPTAPSIIKRRIDSLQKSSSCLFSDLTQAHEDIYITEEIRRAAEELSSVYGLPDFDLESITYYGINGAPTITDLSWPVAKQIRKTLQELEWMVAVLTTASCRLDDQIGTGGNRENAHLNELVRGLIDLYRETAENPRGPYRHDLEEEDRGEVLTFLHCCLSPIGVDRSYSALRGIYSRVT